MKKYLLIICTIIFASRMVACGAEGGSEFGNPSRPVIGILEAESGGAALVKTAVGTCPADEVVAVNSLDDETVAFIESDCSFRLEMTANRAYVIKFFSNDEFVALLVVKNNPSASEKNVFVLSEEEEAIDLGLITINGKRAFPENEPSKQNDQDGDGIKDFDDDDDDNDGIPDDEEADCDNDGFPDDFDDDISEC